MSQDSIQVSTTPPLPGLQMVQQVNAALTSIATDFSGDTDPAAQAGAFMTWADTANNLVKRRNPSNTAWIVVGDLWQRPMTTYDSGSIPSSDKGVIFVSPYGWMEWNSSAGFYMSIGCGRVEWFMTSTVPTGYIKANGATVSRTTYKGLFYLMGTTYGAGDGSTTFVAGRDMRGEFPRGWDDGRGVDAGRSLASAQADAFKTHGHSINIATIATGGSFSGGQVDFASGRGGTNYSTNANSDGGGAETRPRNVALMACLKY